MAHSNPVLVKQPSFTVVGLPIQASLNEMAAIDATKEAFLARADEVPHRANNEICLVQVYPHEPFTNDTQFTTIFGAKVEQVTELPEGMISHTVPGGEFVKVTHYGPEADLKETYPAINDWLHAHGRWHGGHDYEIWDDRYKPNQADNEITIYVALDPELNYPSLIQRELHAATVKHTAKFADYAQIIPTAVEQFQPRLVEIPNRTTTQVILYEPHLGQEVGSFYLGVETTSEPATLPSDLISVEASGTYAAARGDYRNTPEIYDRLVAWIKEKGLTPAGPEALLIEVYDKVGTYEVEVWLPIQA